MKMFIPLRQGTFNTSVNASAAIVATIGMSTFLSDAESAILWVQYASGTNAALQLTWNNLSSTVVVNPTYGETGSTVVATNVLYNYYLPVMGDDSILFSPSVSGTVTFFLMGLINDT